jgi:hypothetical protein
MSSILPKKRTKNQPEVPQYCWVEFFSFLHLFLGELRIHKLLLRFTDLSCGKVTKIQRVFLFIWTEKRSIMKNIMFLIASFS